MLRRNQDLLTAQMSAEPLSANQLAMRLHVGSTRKSRVMCILTAEVEETERVSLEEGLYKWKKGAIYES